MALLPTVNPGDWGQVDRNFNKLVKFFIGPNATPTYTGLTLSDLTQGSVVFAGANGIISQDNSNLFWDDTNNRLGIGTNAPDSVFHIKANTPGTVGSHPAGQLIIQDPDDTVFGNAVITGYESDANGNPDQQLWYLGSSSSSNSEIIFLNRRNSKLHLGTNGIVRMTIESGAGSGNVGIGITSPKTKLTIEGALTLKEQAAADGDTAAYGQVWCKDDVPNTLWFVNDLGTEIRIAPQDLQTNASPQFTGIELGHASDTTITRVSAGVIAVEGTNVVMVGGAHHDGFSDSVANEHIDHTGVTLTAGAGLTGGGDISANRTFAVDGLLEDLDTLGANAADSEFLVGTGIGTLAWESGATARTSLGLTIGTNVQAWDASLDSIAALTYASDSFIKVTAEDTYAIRTIAETKTDLSLNLVENTALSTWAGTANITTLGTIGSGTWQSTDVGIAYGGTGQSTAQLAINALTAVSGATNEHVLTKDTGTGNAIFKASVGGTDEKVKIDAAATADYIGAASSDGTLRTSGGLSYTDGGNFVTVGCNNPVSGSDTGAYEFTAGNFTMDGSWYDLDCSGTVPAGATFIIFCVTVQDNAVNSKFQMRKNGFSDIYNNNRVRTQIINSSVDCTMIVPCDVDRKVEYMASVALTTVNINIVGWFLG